jgi:hypothetical protein
LASRENRREEGSEKKGEEKFQATGIPICIF